MSAADEHGILHAARCPRPVSWTPSTHVLTLRYGSRVQALRCPYCRAPAIPELTSTSEESAC
jgi:hypothetical protein